MPIRDPIARRQWYRDRRAEIRSIIIAAKDVPCTDCGVRYPTCVMQFDHVHGNKVIAIGSATALTRSIRALYEEISKCEVVCANCHAIRTEIRKVSPNGGQPVLKTGNG